MESCGVSSISRFVYISPAGGYGRGFQRTSVSQARMWWSDQAQLLKIALSEMSITCVQDTWKSNGSHWTIRHRDSPTEPLSPSVSLTQTMEFLKGTDRNTNLSECLQEEATVNILLNEHPFEPQKPDVYFQLFPALIGRFKPAAVPHSGVRWHFRIKNSWLAAVS